MADPALPNELGFAEFVAKLITEMFGAIINAQLGQEKSMAELALASEIGIEEYINRYITEEQVTTELIRLFPGSSIEQPTTVYEGAKYSPATKRKKEQPAIKEILGIELDESDYEPIGRRYALKESAITKINNLISTQIATDQQFAIQQILNRGVPRVIADSGKINAKLTYEVVTEEEAEEPARVERIASPLTRLSNQSFLATAPALSKFHLLVRQADERAPQTTNLKANVFGEVEITFKTVT